MSSIFVRGCSRGLQSPKSRILTMKTRQRFVIATLILALQLGLGLAVRAAESLPAQITDEEFWKLSSESSELDGTFRSDNLLSNESYFQFVIPKLKEATVEDRVYMGVGPEQNFTYIAALKPRMAFIVDIRRGNLDLQLLYKALFELSKDRADFVSLLFSRKRPGTRAGVQRSRNLCCLRENFFQRGTVHGKSQANS